MSVMEERKFSRRRHLMCLLPPGTGEELLQPSLKNRREGLRGEKVRETSLAFCYAFF